jgi:hypothetical protein
MQNANMSVLKIPTDYQIQNMACFIRLPVICALEFNFEVNECFGELASISWALPLSWQRADPLPQPTRPLLHSPHKAARRSPPPLANRDKMHNGLIS